MTQTKKEIEAGMKFINPTKKLWPYQISAVDDEIVAVSWIEDGDIVSTLYEKKEILQFLKSGTWVAADPKTSVVHPSSSPATEAAGEGLPEDDMRKFTDEEMAVFNEAVDMAMQPSQPVQGSLSEAVAFMEWVKSEGYKPRGKTDWCIYRTHVADIEVYTTEGLYNIFKNKKGGTEQ